MDMSVDMETPRCGSSFSEFAAVSENYVKNIIEQSKPKSCMLDPAPTNIVKQSAEVLAGSLPKLINASLSSGIFPASLIKGVIRPSVKRQTLDFDIYSSYRPITNVAFLSKTLERVAVTPTVNFLIDNHLLAKLQSAHRSFHSTETALLRMLSDALYAIDKHQEVVLVLYISPRRLIP